MDDLRFQQQREAAAEPRATDSAATAASPQATAVFDSPKPTSAGGSGEETTTSGTSPIGGAGASTSAAPRTPTARAAAPRAGGAAGSATGGLEFQKAVAGSTLYGALSAMCLLMALVCLLVPGMVSSLGWQSHAALAS